MNESTASPNYRQSVGVMSAAQLVTGLGDQIYSVALPWLVFNLAESAFQVGVFRAIESSATAVTGIAAGVLVDRLGPRRTLALVALLGPLVLLLVPAAQFGGRLSFPLLCLVGFLSLSLHRLKWTSWYSSIPRVVPKAHLSQANAALQLSHAAEAAVGPALAGLLINGLGAIRSLFADMLSFGALWIALPFVPARPAEAPRGGAVWSETREGLRFLVGNRTIWAFTLFVGALNVMLGSVIIVTLLKLRTEFHASAGRTGLVLIGAGAGAVFGSIVSPVLVRRLQMRVVDIIGVAALALAAMGMARSDAALSLSLALVTFSVTVGNIGYHTVRQTLTPDHLQGRVTGTSVALHRSLVPLGAALLGFLTEWKGASSTLIFMGSWVLIALAVFRRYLRGRAQVELKL